MLFVAIYLAFCGALVWLGTGVYWLVTARVPLDQSPTVWDHYFPKLRTSGLLAARPNENDEWFDLLLIGGSVLDPGWGRVEAELWERLNKHAPGRYRLFNLAESGFTSRDSLVQYEHLADMRFDLVLVYDGINDVRMNCCPPDEFRDDYSHFARYRGMDTRIEAGRISLPAAALDRLQTVAGSLPLGTTDPRLIDYAADPRTTAALRENLARIARTARQRGDPLVLLTYAWYIPSDYSAERFRDRQLDYSQESTHPCGVEMWGRPEYVAKALRLQNEAIRELASQPPATRLVDLAATLPAVGPNFNDPCHLTAAGSRLFVEQIWPDVERAFDEWTEHK